jgi:hypothetical protein
MKTIIPLYVAIMALAFNGCTQKRSVDRAEKIFELRETSVGLVRFNAFDGDCWILKQDGSKSEWIEIKDQSEDPLGLGLKTK